MGYVSNSDLWRTAEFLWNILNNFCFHNKIKSDSKILIPFCESTLFIGINIVVGNRRNDRVKKDVSNNAAINHEELIISHFVLRKDDVLVISYKRKFLDQTNLTDQEIIDTEDKG